MKEPSELNFKVGKLNDKSGLINENFRKNDLSLLSSSSEKKKPLNDEFLNINFKSGPISGK